MNGRVAIAVMAKSPRPGRTKTRLCPPLSPEQAAVMAAAFLRDVTDNVARAGATVPIDGWVAYAPAGDEALFDGMLAPGTRLLLADGDGEDAAGVSGFGRCLLQAMRRLLGMGYEAACVLNADSPTLPPEHLTRLASDLLAGRPAVLGAAEDGGYYVLGAREPYPRLFADILWSSDRVAAQTRERASELGVPLAELPVWYDVDDSAAWRRLLGELAADPGVAMATRAAVTRLGIA